MEFHATSSNVLLDKRESTKHGVTKDPMKIMPNVIYQTKEEEKLNTLKPTKYPISPRCPQKVESHATSSNCHIVKTWRLSNRGFDVEHAMCHIPYKTPQQGDQDAMPSMPKEVRAFS